MFVKPFAAFGAVLLSSIVAVSLCSSGPALAADASDAAPANSAIEGGLQTSEANPRRNREAPVGTPDQSLWRALPGRTQRSQASETPLPALDRPRSLLNGLFEGSETSSFPDP